MIKIVAAVKKVAVRIGVITASFAFVVVVLAVTGIASVAASISSDDSTDPSGSAGSNGNYTGNSQDVLVWESTVSQIATQYGMDGFTGLILAVMEQESGGRGNDPMQAAEGEFNTEYPKVPNGITDPLYSIQCGVQELKKALQIANSGDGKTYAANGSLPSPGDLAKISLALQGYNFGPGWFDFAGGTYSLDKAEAFSEAQAAKEGKSSYGDPQYVPHVLRYFATSTSASGEFAWPVPGHTTITSGFGQRTDPITGGTENHPGIDISDGSINGAPIVAADSGTVIQAGFGVSGSGYGGYGNCVAIDHGNGLVTVYGHMSSVACAVGASVQKGQVIGYVGSTGDSTGPHLHFEVRLNGTATDPMPYLQGTT